MRKANIYLIEDDLDLLVAMNNCLSTSFNLFSFISAENFIDNISILEFPDVILIDLHLCGNADGFDILSMLKSSRNYSFIPTIVISGSSCENDVNKSFQLGANDFLGKPFNTNILKYKIDNLLKIKNIDMELLYKIPVSVLTLFTDKSSINFKENFEKIILQDISDPNLSTNYLADKMNMSISTLVRYVKKIYNLSPNEYIINIRIERAKYLLLNTSGSINYIAYAVGISSTSYFCHLFKQKIGYSPYKFKKNKTEADV
jgi:AraC-like DNA-binding protein